MCVYIYIYIHWQANILIHSTESAEQLLKGASGLIFLPSHYIPRIYEYLYEYRVTMFKMTDPPQVTLGLCTPLPRFLQPRKGDEVI